MKARTLHEEYPVLQAFATRGLRRKEAVELASRILKLKPFWNDLEDVRRELVHEHALYDEDGNTIPLEDGGIKLGNSVAFQESWQESLEAELDVPSIKPMNLEDLITAANTKQTKGKKGKGDEEATIAPLILSSLAALGIVRLPDDEGEEDEEDEGSESE